MCVKGKMEQQEPGSSSSLTRKNPSGKYVRFGQKKIIVNLYSEIMKKRPRKKYRDIMATLSQQTGVGLSTVKGTIAVYIKTGKVSSSNEKRSKLSTM
ncbi:hypothetical protein ANTPLA_LOCUS6733 [Anthophora plagiata]